MIDLKRLPRPESVTPPTHYAMRRFAGPAAFLLVMTFLAQSFLGAHDLTRMPMVAGWDHLLSAG